MIGRGDLAWPGVPIALASAALFGASTPFAKLLLGGGMDPWLLAGLLYLGAGIGVALVELVRCSFGRARSEAPLRRKDLPWLALITMMGGILGPVLLMLGLTRTDASTAALLLNLEGLATMGIAWILFHEPVDKRLLIGAGAILAGALLLSWRGQGALGWGALAIAGACVAWGFDNNLTRKLSSVDPVQIATVKGLVAGAVNVALAIVHGTTLPPSSSLAGAGLVGLFGYGASLVLFVLALRYLGTARTAAYFSCAPFIGATLSVLMLQEPITARLIIAGLLMAAGVYLHLSEAHEHEHAHEAVDHEHRHVHDEHHRHVHEAAGLPDQPHSHRHRHTGLVHRHPHYPDPHHRHGHEVREQNNHEVREQNNHEETRGMRRLAVLPPSILTAVLGVALLLLQFVPQAVAQGSEMMSGGCMGMNCMSGPGAGMMGGMGGSMLRHQEFMMDRIPEPYASMTNPLPNTAEVIARGRAVFEQSCASCHGTEGVGNGEAGRELSPPPADLAMLVRMPMMRDDRYLFWAISEGGAAFGTAMPAFNDSLSDEEMWSVVRFLQAGLPLK